tara:strand:- start:1716 stop:2135 length:420 start_codon:yes stop_codon:yes gene_type:complete
MAKTTPRTNALNALQKLVRLKAADDQGFCACVTCGHVSQWNVGMQGGHFIAKGKGGTNEWALIEENVHPQCAGCNGFRMKYGNAEAAYTLYMVDMYGREQVDLMIERNQVVKHSKQDLFDMTADWKQQINFHLKRIGQA